MVAELKRNDGSPISYPTGCAFDGGLLWFVELDESDKEFGIRAFDLKRNEIIHWVRSADKAMAGIAWDEKRFWISSRDGGFYEVEREAALHYGSVDKARGAGFRGKYVQLAYGLGHLWGLDSDARVIHKIKITD